MATPPSAVELAMTEALSINGGFPHMAVKEKLICFLLKISQRYT